jgi:septum site-determining protein MinC
LDKEVMSELISIKGSRDGLRLQLDATVDWVMLMEHLAQEFDRNRGFFAGAKLAIDAGERQMAEDQIGEMLKLMQHHGVEPESFSAEPRETRAAARAVGLKVRLPSRRQPETTEPAQAAALLVAKTMRSGQVLRHQGHVTLIGDVNPGAEVIAGGSIVIWGRVRGLVHAGALGDAEAVVCALELRPTQLRIADQITVTPDDQARLAPEIARIADGQIVVEPWEAHKR